MVCTDTVFFRIQFTGKWPLEKKKKMFKKRAKFLKMCPCYRVAENPDKGDIGYCALGDQTECAGDIQSCENPELLNKHILEQGLGWKKKTGRNGLKRVLQVIGRLANTYWW